MQQNNVMQVDGSTKITIHMTKMSEDERNALLRAEEALTREETAAGPK